MLYNYVITDGGHGTETNLASQKFLKSKGFNPGKIDGNWGGRTAKAMQRYCITSVVHGFVCLLLLFVNDIFLYVIR